MEVSKSSDTTVQGDFLPEKESENTFNKLMLKIKEKDIKYQLFEVSIYIFIFNYSMNLF